MQTVVFYIFLIHFIVGPIVDSYTVNFTFLDWLRNSQMFCSANQHLRPALLPNLASKSAAVSFVCKIRNTVTSLLNDYLITNSFLHIQILSLKNTVILYCTWLRTVQDFTFLKIKYSDKDYLNFIEGRNISWIFFWPLKILREIVNSRLVILIIASKGGATYRSSRFQVVASRALQSVARVKQFCSPYM